MKLLLKAIVLEMALTVLPAGMAMAQTSPKQTKPPSNWQKMKECSEQTDRIAKRREWGEMKQEGSKIMLSWKNHYSPKYDRCFIQAFYVVSMPEKERLWRQIPSQYEELWDAFENNVVAMAVVTGLFRELPPDNYEGVGYCWIEGKAQPCEQCFQFIEERMKN